MWLRHLLVARWGCRPRDFEKAVSPAARVSHDREPAAPFAGVPICGEAGRLPKGFVAPFSRREQLRRTILQRAGFHLFLGPKKFLKNLKKGLAIFEMVWYHYEAVERDGKNEIVGVDCREGPPVPIPNTEVKLAGAEDTWLVTARKNRFSPTLRTTCICRWFFVLPVTSYSNFPRFSAGVFPVFRQFFCGFSLDLPPCMT